MTNLEREFYSYALVKGVRLDQSDDAMWRLLLGFLSEYFERKG